MSPATPTARALAHGWALTSALVIVLLTCLGALIAPETLPLPRVFGYHELRAPSAAIAGLGLCLATLAAAREPAPQLLATADARRRAASPARILVVGAVGIASLCLLAGASPHHAVVASAALVGEGLLVASVAGLSVAWSLPTMHMLAALVLGGAGRHGLSWWAWIIGADPSLGSWMASIGLAVLGLAAWTLRLRRPR